MDALHVEQKSFNFQFWWKFVFPSIGTSTMTVSNKTDGWGLSESGIEQKAIFNDE